MRFGLEAAGDKIVAIEPSNKTTGDTLIGVVICRSGAYILDKFLANQKIIQTNSPSSRLILATCEPDFAAELEIALKQQKINGCVLQYETVKPKHARSRTWNITCGREVIRQYTLRDIDAKHLLFCDADMTYDQNVIDVMAKELRGYDIVYSGYALRDFGIALTGPGCCFLDIDLFKEIGFRCLEFKNGTVMTEDTMFELDLMRLGKRIKKGFFVTTNHYYDSLQVKSVSPQPVGLYRRITHSRLLRYVLIRASIAFRSDIGWVVNGYMHRVLCKIRVISGRHQKDSTT